MNPELADLVASCGGVVFIPYDTKPLEEAKTAVHIQRGAVTLANAGNLSMNITQASFKPSVPVIVNISSQNYKLTEELGKELLQYMASISKAIEQYNIRIGALQLEPTVTSNEHVNYYATKIIAQCVIPQIFWKIHTSEDILTSIRLGQSFNGQDILT
jgi:hypothetical protein